MIMLTVYSFGDDEVLMVPEGSVVQDLLVSSMFK